MKTLIKFENTILLHVARIKLDSNRIREKKKKMKRKTVYKNGNSYDEFIQSMSLAIKKLL